MEIMEKMNLNLIKMLLPQGPTLNFLSNMSQQIAFIIEISSS